MKKLKISLFLVWSLCFCFQKIEAQVYGIFNDGIREINLCNCTIGDDAVGPGTAAALAVGPNQELYYFDIDTKEIIKIDLVSGATSVLALMPPNLFSVSMVFGPDGFLYLSGVDLGNPVVETLYRVNPSNGAVTNLGNLPSGIFTQGDLFFNNGLLYGLAEIASVSVLVQIPTANPAGTTVVQNLPNINNLVGGVSVLFEGVETVFSIAQDFNGNVGIIDLNISTGAHQFVCLGPIGGAGDLAAPPNYAVPTCCPNDAGSFSTTNLIGDCLDKSITLNHLGDEVLNPDAALSFILFEEDGLNFPDDIYQISSTPTFFFDPSYMIPFGTYLVAAVAAPGTPGNPNWSGDCIDYSLFAQIAWYPLPEVQLAGAAPEICGSECAEFPLELIGYGTINLSWSVNLNGQNQIGVLSGEAGAQTLTICPPSGQVFPVGNFDLQFLQISDFYCTCP